MRFGFCVVSVKRQKKKKQFKTNMVAHEPI